nr:sialidase family protein [Candidatus Prometheoarchaeum syntrophicum]QEE17649.1 hypothetical protein DSAG12_03486 [Candidatus Prometheoarchaeum syntrophicum]
MDEFLFEKIRLRGSNCESIKFIEFPHGEWFLSYITENKTQIRFMQKISDKTPWTDEISQNSSEFERTLTKFSQISKISLFFDNKGDLILLFNSLNSENLLDLFLLSSYNYGKSWEKEPQLISHEYTSWKLHSNPIILSKGIKMGNILIPIENELVKRSLVLISEDNRKNWHLSLYVEPDEEFEDGKDILGSTSPVIIEEKNDNLRLLCWISNQKSIVSYVSSDFGATWYESDQFSQLNIEKNGDFDAIRLKNNDGSYSEKIFIIGAQQKKGKYQIVVWALEDNSPDIQVFWKNDVYYPSSPKFCQIYQDSCGRNHFLYKFEDEIVHHYWQIEKNADK